KYAETLRANPQAGADGLEKSEREYAKLASHFPSEAETATRARAQIIPQLVDLWLAKPGFPKAIQKVDDAEWAKDEKDSATQRIRDKKLDELRALVVNQD